MPKNKNILFVCFLSQTCNPKHPDYLKTGALCVSEGINDTLTLFRWRVSAPTGRDGVTSDLHNVESNTFFATTKGITLDSIYFDGGKCHLYVSFWVCFGVFLLVYSFFLHLPPVV